MSFSVRDDQLSFLARLWLERPTRSDRFWRGSLHWVDRFNDTVPETANGEAFESADELVRLVDAKLTSLGGPTLRWSKRS